MATALTGALSLLNMSTSWSVDRVITSSRPRRYPYTHTHHKYTVYITVSTATALAPLLSYEYSALKASMYSALLLL